MVQIEGGFVGVPTKSGRVRGTARLEVAFLVREMCRDRSGVNNLTRPYDRGDALSGAGPPGRG